MHRFLYILLALWLCAAALYPQDLRWQNLGNLKEARFFYTLAALDNNRAMVMGGYTGVTNLLNSSWAAEQTTKTTEIINVQNRTISAGAPMNVAHAEAAMLITRDSNIIILSGVTNSRAQLTPVVEMYDRRTQSWKILGTLILARRQHTAAWLNDNEILVAGGLKTDLTTVSSAEIFNIRTGRSRQTTDLPMPFNAAVSERSLSGKVIVFGGRTGGANSSRTKNVYAYDTTAKQWSIQSEYPEAITTLRFIRLSDGRLLVCGGSINDQFTSLYSNRIVLEQETGFQTFGYMQTPRSWYHGLAQWDANFVITMGGIPNIENPATLGTADWIDLRQKRVFPAPAMSVPRTIFNALNLPKLNEKGEQIGSRIIAVSGLSSLSSLTSSVEILEGETAQISQPGSTPATLPAPQVTVVAKTCSTMVAQLRFTGTAANKTIDRIELDNAGSSNVFLDVASAVPDVAVYVIVRSQAPERLAKARVVLYSGQEATAVWIDSLGSAGSLNVAATTPSQLRDGEVIFDASTLQGNPLQLYTQYCREITLRNTSYETLLVTGLEARQGMMFSGLLPRVPLRIAPLSEARITLCFTPLATGEHRDTLVVSHSGCGSASGATLRIPVVGTIPQPPAFTAGQSADRVQPSQTPVQSATGRIIAEKPFPNPAADMIEIPFHYQITVGVTSQRLSKNIENVIYKLYNTNGTLLKTGIAPVAQFASESVMPYYAGIVRVPLDGLGNGQYLVVIQHPNNGTLRTTTVSFIKQR